MKKKLSAYWWCQIIGWSTYTLLETIAYAPLTPTSFSGTFFLVLLDAIIGLCVSHLMRLFIIKTGILQKSISRQVAYLLLITPLFSFLFGFVYFWAIIIITNVDKSFFIVGRAFQPDGPDSLVTVLYPNIFLGIWNLIYFSYYYVRKSQQENIERIRLESELKIHQLESDKTKLQFEKGIADVSLIALRAQMNPHFIFNCLNSIKLYTTQSKSEAASEYLTQFSRLIRLVIENSAKEKISLTTELETLCLYIDMEAMRFKEKLQYKVNIEKDVDADYIELPPLLLQPYVENAIWHGLMPKEEGGKINIDIAINNDKSLLQITITDDGIGRAKSVVLKSKNPTKHTSYGMQFTSDRIALINQVYKTGAAVNIDDLVDDDAKPSGTKVMIQIPL